jgi:hypothetical protein
VSFLIPTKRTTTPHLERLVGVALAHVGHHGAPKRLALPDTDPGRVFQRDDALGRKKNVSAASHNEPGRRATHLELGRHCWSRFDGVAEHLPEPWDGRVSARPQNLCREKQHDNKFFGGNTTPRLTTNLATNHSTNYVRRSSNALIRSPQKFSPHSANASALGGPWYIRSTLACVWRTWSPSTQRSLGGEGWTGVWIPSRRAKREEHGGECLVRV